MRIKIFIAIAIFLSSFAVSADVLRGVREITILVEKLDEDASKCNLSEDMIDAAIRLPLSNSKIRIVKPEDYPDSYLYAYVIAVDSGVMCRLYVELAYRKYIRTEKAFGQFWRKNLIMSSNKTSVAKTVGDSFEAYAKQFVSAWLKANSD